jgi:hypothetical protein
MEEEEEIKQREDSIKMINLLKSNIEKTINRYLSGKFVSYNSFLSNLFRGVSSLSVFPDLNIILNILSSIDHPFPLDYISKLRELSTMDKSSQNSYLSKL